jgi:hypothetical protein
MHAHADTRGAGLSKWADVRRLVRRVVTLVSSLRRRQAVGCFGTVSASLSGAVPDHGQQYRSTQRHESVVTADDVAPRAVRCRIQDSGPCGGPTRAPASAGGRVGSWISRVPGGCGTKRSYGCRATAPTPAARDLDDRGQAAAGRAT